MTTTSIIDRPILFSGPMVRAILEDRKTQTRRVIDRVAGFGAVKSFSASDTQGYDFHFRCRRGLWQDLRRSELLARCPYGEVGDRLWVRETLFIDDYRCVDVAPSLWPTDVLKDAIYYRADGECCDQIAECECASVGKPRWTPSILMPRWASRITLDIVDVRVERLCEISEEDAIAEGLSSVTKDGSLWKYGIPDRDGLPGTDNYGRPWAEWSADPRDAFRALWESINGSGSWSANPWVWVVEFKRVADEATPEPAA